MRAQNAAQTEIKTCIVKVASYDGRTNMSGTLYSPISGERAFSNLAQLFFMMDRVLDVNSFPRRAADLRYPAGGRGVPEGSPGKSALLATFSIRVLYRENFSWQGRFVWREKARSLDFRSELELAYMIDSALKSIPAEQNPEKFDFRGETGS